MRVAELPIGLLAAGPALADRLRLVQFPPESEPILGFALTCGAVRCSGTGQFIVPGGAGLG